MKNPFRGYIIFLSRDSGRHIVGYGPMSYIASLLTQGEGCNFDPKKNRHACHRMMQIIARYVVSNLMAVVRDKVAKEAEELFKSGKCAAAVVPLQRAIYLGHLPSRALMAHMMLEGREGVAQDCIRAFKLAKEGAHLGCHHCQGVMANCYRLHRGIQIDTAQSFELARKSSGKGSRYGQWVLALFYWIGIVGVAEDRAQAVALYRLAAAQGLDDACFSLGFVYELGDGVAQDFAEALRWYQLAATQGHPVALYNYRSLSRRLSRRS